MTNRPPSSPRGGERGAQRHAAFQVARRTPLTPEYYPLQRSDAQAPRVLGTPIQHAVETSLPAAHHCLNATRRQGDGQPTPTRAKG